MSYQDPTYYNPTNYQPSPLSSATGRSYQGVSFSATVAHTSTTNPMPDHAASLAELQRRVNPYPSVNPLPNAAVVTIADKARQSLMNFAVEVLLVMQDEGVMTNESIKSILKYFDSSEVYIICGKYVMQVQGKNKAAPSVSPSPKKTDESTEVSKQFSLKEVWKGIKKAAFNILFTPKKTVEVPNGTVESQPKAEHEASASVEVASATLVAGQEKK